MFPGFLLAFEVVFLILFGLLVDYDRTGIPNPSMQAAQEGATADNTQTVYACKFLLVNVLSRPSVTFQTLCQKQRDQ